MEPLEIALIIVGAVLFIIIIWCVATRNHLHRLIIKVEESVSGIDVALTKRYDVLIKSLDTAKGYAKHESETLEKIVNLRGNSLRDLSVMEKAEISKGLDQMQSGLRVLVENYPQLKADKVFGNLQAVIADVEEHLQAARRLYNSNVSILNQAVVSWPRSIIARRIGIKQKDFFEAESAKKSDVKMDF